MKTNPLKEGLLTEHSCGIGSVTRKMARERATELAIINGRTAQEVSKSDWEQAKRELLLSDPNPARRSSATRFGSLRQVQSHGAARQIHCGDGNSGG